MPEVDDPLYSEPTLTQAGLARKARISRVALGKIERGEVHPRSGTLVQLARALEAHLRELVAPVEPLRGVRFRAGKRLNSREQILAEVRIWCG